MLALFSSRDISSSGCISFEVKPELDSGFLICGAPVMVALEGGEAETAAADGNVGLGGALLVAGAVLNRGPDDVTGLDECDNETDDGAVDV